MSAEPLLMPIMSHPLTGQSPVKVTEICDIVACKGELCGCELASGFNLHYLHSNLVLQNLNNLGYHITLGVTLWHEKVLYSIDMYFQHF